MEDKEIKIELKKLLAILILTVVLIIGYEIAKNYTTENEPIEEPHTEPTIVDEPVKEEGIVDEDIPYKIEETGNETGIDDWNSDATPQYTDVYEFNSIKSSMAGSIDGAAVEESAMADSAEDRTIGFSTGGAKDVNNFRENIDDGYLPISSDITYNGLFYDYYFDTKNDNSKKSEELFSPSYSTAVSNDPISGKEEYYMTVGLNSNIKESDFERKKLNLTVVLDISGSMGSSFDTYYYNNKISNLSTRSKMEIANDAVCYLTDHLKDTDRFGMVLFESSSYEVKPMSLVGDVNMTAIKKHIQDIKEKGGTNFEAGYQSANKYYEEYKNINSDEYENRIIVITDAMPNIGNLSENGLLDMVKKNAENGIYTTFVGVGVDFNTELIETISDVRGANYYSVHYAKEFKERMDDQFEYMVTPLVFDLNLTLSSNDFEIEKVYGSDSKNMLNGDIMSVNTLFPSKSNSSGDVKGGIVLLKLKKKGDATSSKVDVSVSYKNRKMEEFNNSQSIDFSSTSEHYDNTGIQKAIVLTRYANAIKNWILYERSDDDIFMINNSKGIIDCDYSAEETYSLLGKYERTSQKLDVSDEYKKIFETIRDYMVKENATIKDNSLNQEVDILNYLIDY